MSPRIGLCVSDATILPKSYKIVTLIASERVVQGYSREFRKLFFVIREELELLIDIRDFTAVFYVILRRESSGPNSYSRLWRVTWVYKLQYMEP